MSKIFTVYDSKAEAYLQPFFASATGAGIRSFAEAADTTDHQFHKYGADYSLFEIGEWDEQSGMMVIHVAKINLGTALELAAGAPAKNWDQWHEDPSKGKPLAEATMETIEELRAALVVKGGE